MMGSKNEGAQREAKHVVVVRRISALEEKVEALERLLAQVSGGDRATEECEPTKKEGPPVCLSSLLATLPEVLDVLINRLGSVENDLRKSLF